MGKWKRAAILSAAVLTSALGTIVAAPSASAADNGFVSFSDHSISFPTMCVTEHNGTGDTIRHECQTLIHKTQRYFFSPDTKSAFLTVNNGELGHYDFALAPGRSNCYRESFSGSVHRATDKRCTPY